MKDPEVRGLPLPRERASQSGSPEIIEVLSIAGLCVAAAIGYGILHDLVTAHVCVEYFTIGHPDLFNTGNPILLALGWGVVATWYVGAVLSIPMVCAARLGLHPRRCARDLIKPLAALLLAMGILALIAGLIGNWLAITRNISLPAGLEDLVPSAQHASFVADLWAHGASYSAGFLGGSILPIVVWRSRQRVSGT
jgi:H+/Cl- antiporter ClcA